MPIFNDVSQLSLLLENVKRRPDLYNSDDLRPSRKDILLRQQLWQEVANIVGESVDDCRRTWQKMRRVYKKEFATGGSTWMWMDSMAFYQPYMYSVTETRLLEDFDLSDDEPLQNKQTLSVLCLSTPSVGRQEKKTPGSKGRKGYAAKSTCQLPTLKSSKRSRSPGSVSSRSGAVSPHSSSSLSKISRVKSPAAPERKATSQNRLSLRVSPPPASTPSAPPTAGTESKKDFINMAEYHFVCCLLEMLEDVPQNKRNFVKAKLMAEIANAYQQ
ncbi:hypothetical protein EB796_017936 [Bugula neritina]|uniref:MADF domain-containing protein n=1 Tax=Bugula neritina TaxID=10212 RepID=A0A7J7JBX2_BUGNE|nr:hypothetical protein EB796_017936 [Bugula neritina]